jgi:ketosteroid isomerase-like protein
VPRPRRRLLALGCLAVLAGGAVAGCGADTEASEDEDAVRQVVLRFGEATRARDWQTICDELFTSNLVAKVEAIGLPCETALEKGFEDVRNPVLVVRDVGVNGSRALVSVSSRAEGQPPSDDAIQLVREDDAWRIASLASPDDPGTSTSTTATTATATETATTTTETATTTSGR